MGVVTLLLVVALAAAQLGFAVYAAQQAGTAARAGARVASDGVGQRQRGSSVARESMSEWVAKKASFRTSGGAGSVTVTVRVKVPKLLPLFNFRPIEKSATMPTD